MRVINGQRGKLAIFKFDDKSGVIEATADEALINANKDLLVDDSLIIVQAKLQPDRFSGGHRLAINKIWDLASARCRFGKYLSVKTPHDLHSFSHSLRSIIKDFPPRRELTDQGEFFKGLGVRFEIERSSHGVAATAQIQLGESARFFPSDAALASWYAAVDASQLKLVY
jgi:DNA polymerase-3 subunit alpha